MAREPGTTEQMHCQVVPYLFSCVQCHGFTLPNMDIRHFMPLDLHTQFFVWSNVEKLQWGEAQIVYISVFLIKIMFS